MKDIVLLSLFTTIIYAKIVELNEANFDSFVKTNPVVLVEFYSPGCKRCQEFSPVYSEVAEIVEKEYKPYIIAKVDINQNDRLADTFAGGKLPIIRLFLDGEQVPYAGESTSKYIMQYIENIYKEIFPYVEITSDQLKLRSEARTLSLIMAGGTKEELELYGKISKQFRSLWFFHCTPEIARKVYPDTQDKTSIILIKNFDESKMTYTGDIEEKAIESFIKKYTVPRVNGLNQDTINLLFKKTGKQGVILLREETEEGKKVESMFAALAEKHRSEDLLFIVSDIEDGLGKRVAKILSVQKSDLPFIGIIQTKAKLEKTKFEGHFTPEEMEKFIVDYKTAEAKKTDL